MLMDYSQRTRNLARSIVNNYCEYDSLSETYELVNVSEFCLQELAASILIDSKSIASEANGADNNAFDAKMVPALIGLLSDSTNKEKRHDFIEAWLDGVTAYTQTFIDDLLQYYLEDYNSDYAPPFEPELAYATAGNRG